MPKFEYATLQASNAYTPAGGKPGVSVTFPDGLQKTYEEPNALGPALNALGADGWEFSGIAEVWEGGTDYSKVHIMKRAV